MFKFIILDEYQKKAKEDLFEASIAYTMKGGSLPELLVQMRRGPQQEQHHGNFVHLVPYSIGQYGVFSQVFGQELSFFSQSSKN